MRTVSEILFVLGTGLLMLGIVCMMILNNEIAKEENMIEKINKLERENTQLKRENYYLRRIYENMSK